jgi:hypothetical protein
MLTDQNESIVLLVAIIEVWFCVFQTAFMNVVVGMRII